MNIELIVVDISYKSVLRRLLELYQYEFSAIERRDLDEHGLFGYRWLDNYWTEDDRFPYLIRCDGKLAGFVFVRMLTLYPEHEADYSIAEFFVLEKYRRLGVGRECALRIFRRFGGRWVLTVYDQNERAKKFWQSIIGEIADDLMMKLDEDATPARWDYAFSSRKGPGSGVRSPESERNGG